MRRLMRITALLICVSFLLLTVGCVQLPWFDAQKELQEDDYFSTYTDYPCLQGFTPVSREEYYCYNKLNAIQKEIYKGIVKSAERLSTEYIFFENATKRDIATAFHAFNDDYPQFFWIGNSFNYAKKGDEVGFAFHEDSGFVGLNTIDLRDSINKQINDEVARIINETVTPDMSDYEKELKIHDYICKNMTYNKEVLEKETRSDEDMRNWNILGSILDKSGVCESYSKMFQLLMYNIGIKCTVISGVTEEPHMWNAVYIDGGWRYVDVTWDDTKAGTLEYTHCCFNMGQKEYEYHHNPYTNDIRVIPHSDLSSGRVSYFNEECKSDLYYYNVNNLVINKKNFSSIVIPKLKKGWDGEMVSAEFCIADAEVEEKFLKKIIDVKTFFDKFKGAKTVSYIILPNKNAFVLVVSKWTK